MWPSFMPTLPTQPRCQPPSKCSLRDAQCFSALRYHSITLLRAIGCMRVAFG